MTREEVDAAIEQALDLREQMEELEGKYEVAVRPLEQAARDRLNALGKMWAKGGVSATVKAYDELPDMSSTRVDFVMYRYDESTVVAYTPDELAEDPEAVRAARAAAAAENERERAVVRVREAEDALERARAIAAGLGS